MSIIVSAAFTAADLTTLESYTPDVGAAFVKLTALSPATAVIRSNRVAAGGASPAGIYYSPTSPVGAEYDVEADFVFLSPAGDSGIGGRFDSTAATGYFVRDISGGAWDLYKVVAGSFTLLGTYSDPVGYGDVRHVKLQIRDAAKKVFVDGVERISSSDNTITAAGHPGFWMAGDTTSSVGLHFDNYTVDDLVAAGLSVTATATPTATGADLTSTPAGGAGGNTYQWHRSTTPNFTPSGGTAIGGATTQNYSDTAGTPGTVYLYKVVVTDSAATSATSNEVGAEAYRYYLKVGFIGDGQFSNVPAGGSAPPTHFATLAANCGSYLYKVTCSNRGAAGTKTADWVSGSTTLNNAKTAFTTAFGSLSGMWVFVRLKAEDAAGGTTAGTYLTNLTSLVNDLVSAGVAGVILEGALWGLNTYGGAANALKRSYEAQDDTLINGTTIRRGERHLFAYSASYPSVFLETDRYPTEAGSKLMAEAMVKTLIDGILYPVGGLISHPGMAGL
jgi:hypothetical protein